MDLEMGMMNGSNEPSSAFAGRIRIRYEGARPARPIWGQAKARHRKARSV